MRVEGKTKEQREGKRRHAGEKETGSLNKGTNEAISGNSKGDVTRVKHQTRQRHNRLLVGIMMQSYVLMKIDGVNAGELSDPQPDPSLCHPSAKPSKSE